jgi:hypothetical protein
MLAGSHARKEMGRVSENRPADYRLLLKTWAKHRASSAVWEARKGNARKAANAYRRAARAIGSVEVAAKAAKAKFTFFVIDWEATATAELNAPAHLFRDIFGNPFHPVSIDPAWQTAAVLSIAQAIHAQRAFDRMPILADALEDAGCTHTEIFNHCRQPAEHVRGCWVVDFLLGKE